MNNEVVINTKLNTDDVKTGIKDIERNLEDAAKSGDATGRNLGEGIQKGLDSVLSGITDGIEKNIGVNAENNAAVRDMLNDYKELIDVMTEVKAKRDEVLSKMEFFEDNSTDYDSKYYTDLEMALAKLDSQYGSLGEKAYSIQDTLSNAGVRFTEFIDNETGDLINLSSGVEEVSDSIEEIGDSSEEAEKRTVNLIDLLKTGFSMTVRQGLSITGKAISKIGDVAKSAFGTFTNSLKPANLGFARFLKYTLGISSIFVLFNKLRATAKEGFNALAKESNEVNKALSDLKNSMGQFKLQISAAFQPILTSVTPILVGFINLLNEAAVKLSVFFATLSGQNYIYKAKKQTDDYAQSLNGAGAAAKSLKNQLSGLDELNVLNDQSGGGGVSTDQFEKVEIEASQFADNLKDIVNSGDWEGVGDLIAEKIASLFKKLDWNSIRDKSKEAGDNVSDLIKGFFNPDAGLVEEISGAIAGAINSVFEFMNGVVSDKDMWKNISTSFSNGFKRLVEDIDAALIGQTLSNFLVNSLGAAADFLSSSRDTFYTLGQKIADFIININWEELLHNLGSVIMGAIEAVIAVIEGFVDEGGVHRIGEVIAAALTDVEFWKRAFAAVGDIIMVALKAIIELADAAPVATAIVAGIAGAMLIADLTMLGANLSAILAGTTITTAAGAAGNTVGIAFAGAVIAAVGGYQLGKNIGKMLFPDDAQWYDVGFAEQQEIIWGFVADQAEIAVHRIDNAIGNYHTHGIKQYVENMHMAQNANTDFVEYMNAQTESMWTTQVETLTQYNAGMQDAIHNAQDLAGITAVHNYIYGSGTLQMAGFTLQMRESKKATEEFIDVLYENLPGGMGQINILEQSMVSLSGKTLNSLALISNGFDTATKGWANAAVSMKESMKNAFNGIIAGAEGMANGITDGLNAIGNSLKGFKFDIPSWVPEYGGKGFSIDIPTLNKISIPRLAEGAVIPANKEFLAVLGDQKQGTNIEAPLDTIKQALVEVLDDSAFIGYLASINDYTRITSEKEFGVNIGDRDITRANLRGQQQMGRTLITSV